MGAWMCKGWVGWLWVLPGLVSAAPPPVPETPKSPVTNAYFGEVVVDPYRWLEDGRAPAVVEWTRAQNLLTRRMLDGLPERAVVEKRLTELHARAGSSYSGLKPAGSRIFARKHQPPREQALLVTLDDTADPASERILLDPARIDPTGRTSLESFHPSADGSRVAVILASGGSEQGNLQVYETATGSAVDETIPRVAFPTGGASVAWDPDGTGFHYTRYPAPGERPDADLAFHEQLYHHAIGTRIATDQYVIGREFPRIGEVFAAVRPDGRYLRVTMQNGDGGEFSHWLRGPEGTWRRIADYADRVQAIVFGPDDGLYLFSRKGAPKGRILRTRLPEASLDRAVEVVPESEAVIEGYAWRGLEITPNFVVTDDSLIVVDVLGGPSRVRVFDLEGRPRTTDPLPPVSSVDSLVAAGDGTVLFRSTRYVEPPTWYRLDPRNGKIRKTPLVDPAPVSFEDSEVVREFAVSKDGTRVPVNLVFRKGLRRDGTNPVLLTGYGGYGINLSPKFLGIDGRIWLDAGGVYAVANLRGGGEFGDAWHEAGRLTRKQNVFDDFAACTRLLVDQKYTTPSRLAIEGGSNGGLLMGAVLTQHPDAFRAVVAHVGIQDMLRSELDANGAFNVPEFGSVTVEDQFRALHRYSPYHRVVDGVRYPAVFLLTGENDGRVNPYHSRKMAARLQAATGSGNPVLLRVSAGSGHGMGTALSESISQQADVFAFLFEQLGMKPGQ